ncbi:MAG: YncE family protein [Nannocystaceae bacterium]|nr:hypothetical protein [bacterium]
MHRLNTNTGLLGALLLLGPVAMPGCGADLSDEGFDGGSAAGDTDAGAVSASASDGDPGGSDSDGGFGTDGSIPPPEEEEEADFRVPRASGRFVYSASELTDSVAVIDSSNLSIDVVGVGRGPTVVAPLAANGPMQGAVAVLDQGSDDVALLSTDSNGESTVEIIDATPGANNLVVSPDGRFLIVHVDVDGPEEIGPGSDQEITVIDVTDNAVYPMTVGAHPREIAFSSDSSQAFVVTADGVNVIEFDQVDMIGIPDIVPAYTDPGIDPDTLEVQVAADLGIALARVDGNNTLVATDLLTREQQVFELDAVPTDLDIAPDGSFAVLTVPRAAGSQIVELPLPLGTGDLQSHVISQEYVGLAALSPDTDTLLLYTTQNPFENGVPPDEPGGTTTGVDPTGDTDTDTDTDGTTTGPEPEPEPNPDAVPPNRDPRLRLTIARRDGSGWDTSITLFVDRPIKSVGIAPDGASGMLLHQPTEDSIPYAYTLLDLEKEFPVKKLQTVQATPEPILFTPDGARSVVLLRDDAAAIKRVDQVDLQTFIVDGFELGSPPEGTGYVDATDKIFVSQDHPTGRITFIDALGSVETVTGYRLNDAVKD